MHLTAQTNSPSLREFGEGRTSRRSYTFFIAESASSKQGDVDGVAHLGSCMPARLCGEMRRAELCKQG
jgi:hypothetical protein